MHNTYWWKNCWLNTIWVEWRPLRQTKLHVQETGIWLDDCGLLGASLDGLVGDDLLGAKFPYTQRNMLIAEAIKSPKFYLKDDRGNLYLHVWEDHAYCHQVQGELFFTNRKVFYFMVWTTEGTVAVKVFRIDLWASNLNILKTFYLTHLFPKIKKKWIKLL